MQITSPKVSPSKTIHDQLRPLPRSSSRAIIYAFSSKRAPITVIWADSVCLYRSLDERSRERRKTKVDKASSGFVDILKLKVGKGPSNRDRRLLAGECINNRTRGRSRKRAELIVYCFKKRHLWESHLHSGYFILCVCILDGALFGDDMKKICVRPFYNRYMTVGIAS